MIERREKEAMKIGILTFHRVYNYGAVLQAYSLQKILDDLGMDNEIIDFSTVKQRDFLSLYSVHNGLKRFFKTMLLLLFHQERKRRIEQFDDFINHTMKLSTKTYQNEEELAETNYLYHTFVSGSDQIWNITKKADSSDGYFLAFADENKKKISYATSIGTATYEQLLNKKALLEKYQMISCRESDGAATLSRIIGKNVPVVLDPTLLVDHRHLAGLITAVHWCPYLLYYSLDGYNKKDNNINILKALSQKFNLKVLFITPEWPRHSFGQEIIDAGPREFISLIANAALICTNSFHGTALSIKMNRPFYVLEKKNIQDTRKRSLLEQFGLINRIISNCHEIADIEDYSIDYEPVNKKLEIFRTRSMTYIKEAVRLK